jgi:hypothetical protein
MSYCRFGEADAYIYDDVRFGIICCVCSLMPTGDTNGFVDGEEYIALNDNFVAGYDHEKMLTHIAEHRASRDYIPEDVDQRLIRERDCEHEFVETRWGTRCDYCWSPERA